MECKRLNRMIRDWYVQVQDETLAPARMVEFMHEHAEVCDTCFVDPNIKEEIKKITAIVLPPSKMTKKPKKKQPPVEPTAAALAAIEAGSGPAVNAETPVKPDAAAADEEIDEEIEVGDDDDAVEGDTAQAPADDATTTADPAPADKQDEPAQVDATSEPVPSDKQDDPAQPDETAEAKPADKQDDSSPADADLE